MKKEEALKRLTSLENEIKELRKIIESEDKPTKEQRFFELIQGLEMKFDREKYPNSIFFFKGEEFWLRLDLKNKNLWCSYNRFWSVFESEFNLNHQQIKIFIKNMLEEHFKSRVETPSSCFAVTALKLEEHFKSRVETPYSSTSAYTGVLEEHFKSRVETPRIHFKQHYL